jgi:hypothetical protein
MSELSALAGSERYGVCEDEVDSFPIFCPHRKWAAVGKGSFVYKETLYKSYCGSQSSVSEADSSFAKEPVRCGGDES